MKDLDDFIKHLDNVEKTITNKLVRVQRMTAESIRKEAVSLAPGTGRYSDTIKVRETEVKKNKISTRITTDLTVTSKSNGNTYNLGFLLETGTKPHLIRPIDAQALHFQINGEDIFTKLVHHPGFVGFPHFIPSLNDNKEQYMANIKSVLDKEFK